MGRWKPFYALLSAFLFFGLLSVCSTTAWFYAVAAFGVGLFYPPAMSTGMLLMQESVPRARRPFMIVACNVNFSICQIVAVIGSSYLQGMSWRVETLIWYSPFLFLLAVGPFVLKESPEFVAAAGTDMNRQMTPGGSLETMRELFSPVWRKNTFSTLVCWIAVSLSFFGLSYSAGNLSDDFTTNMLLLAMIDACGFLLPGLVLAQLDPQRFQ